MDCGVTCKLKGQAYLAVTAVHSRAAPRKTLGNIVRIISGTGMRETGFEHYAIDAAMSVDVFQMSVVGSRAVLNAKAK